jgi:hypothetical protein
MAYSAWVSVHKLVAESEIVVLAEVEYLTEATDGPQKQQIATARILERWKGSSPDARIRFIASPGWYMCDTSAARAGETVVLFLTKDPREAHPRITHFGRGRLPVRRLEGALVALFDEVRFPPSIPVRRHVYYGESVTLESLKAFVREMTQPL